MINYHKSHLIAQKLGLYQSNVDLLSRVVQTIAPSQESFVGQLTGITQKSVFDTGVSVGRGVMNRVFSKKAAGSFIQQSPQNSIRLLFPNLDFNYSYNDSCRRMLTENFDTDVYEAKSRLAVGDLIPHLKLRDLNSSEIINLRQFLSQIQYDRNMSMEFTVQLLDDKTELCS